MIKKIILGSSGGPETEGVFNSLNETNDSEEIVGIGPNINDLLTSNIPKKYLFISDDISDFNDLNLTKILINPKKTYFDSKVIIFDDFLSLLNYQKN